MISVLASLVLGLLISTAKSSSDGTDHAMRTFSADLILLDETLRDFGGDAKNPRELLRRYTAKALQDHWPADESKPANIDNDATGMLLERVREQIRALRPVDAGQRELQQESLGISSSLLRQRWLLIEQEGPGVRPLVLAVLVSWVFIIFTSFGRLRRGDRRFGVSHHGAGQPIRGAAAHFERPDGERAGAYRRTVTGGSQRLRRGRFHAIMANRKGVGRIVFPLSLAPVKYSACVVIRLSSYRPAR
jgi:hypothetical protein